MLNGMLRLSIKNAPMLYPCRANYLLTRFSAPPYNQYLEQLSPKCIPKPTPKVPNTALCTWAGASSALLQPIPAWLLAIRLLLRQDHPRHMHGFIHHLRGKKIEWEGVNGSGGATILIPRQVTNQQASTLDWWTPNQHCCLLQCGRQDLFLSSRAS